MEKHGRLDRLFFGTFFFLRIAALPVRSYLLPNCLIFFEKCSTSLIAATVEFFQCRESGILLRIFPEPGKKNPPAYIRNVVKSYIEPNIFLSNFNDEYH